MKFFDNIFKNSKKKVFEFIDSLPKDYYLASRPNSLYDDSKVKEPKIPKTIIYNTYNEVPEEELYQWYNKMKAEGQYFSKKEYISIMEILGKKYEAELLSDIDKGMIGNYFHWMRDQKKEGKIISSKVYAKVLAYSRGEDWLTDLELKNTGKTIIDKEEIKWLNALYDNYTEEEEYDIHACRKEDNKLMNELEKKLLSGEIKTDDDASIWYDNEKYFKVYRVKFLRKRVVRRLKINGLKLVKLF